ncbi:MAG: twin-arginine translocase TatA/TatE family subunit [Acidimicrobiaceae bacterium]|nr:twin-arginine translocase TatA/TatE family subunit [Acidimicrobiaceae bacterium]MCY3645143.1 twin-arginine translocase TatA/TatE family subunit [Acidimicrobiaceae bacterium]MDE0495378.1 twin-arginine translocase TatA/TatE family subunit [Acidimicrobiaceae bacterium]MDE0665670.1 twin-arginine translocase TatA/TatE family subunit [Acidimicrobiaceae bacterium]MXW89931.1 twin-arginine translocase TatA/TatE family subunit [Acidimicrobiaceae bacterium]
MANIFAVVPSIGTSELIIILIIVLLVFGGAKLPKLARSLGQAQKEFKDGLSESASEGDGGASKATGSDGNQGAPGKNGSA